MKKKIKFYFGEPRTYQINQYRKSGITVNLIGTDTYTDEEISQICEILENKGIMEIEINLKDKTATPKSPLELEYKNKKCKDCIYFDKEYGCQNDSSKAKSKIYKTSNTKACYWGNFTKT